MGLIVMRHVNDITLEELMEENLHLELEGVDLGVHLLTSKSEDTFIKRFDNNARAIEREIGENGINSIYHSGIERAEITAKALGKKLNYSGEYLADIDLYDRFSPYILEHLKEKKDSIVVAHQPAISRLIRVETSYSEAYRVTGSSLRFFGKLIEQNLEVKV